MGENFIISSWKKVVKIVNPVPPDVKKLRNTIKVLDWTKSDILFGKIVILQKKCGVRPFLANFGPGKKRANYLSVVA